MTGAKEDKRTIIFLEREGGQIYRVGKGGVPDGKVTAIDLMTREHKGVALFFFQITFESGMVEEVAYEQHVRVRHVPSQ